jgi:hypothetical protein
VLGISFLDPSTQPTQPPARMDSNPQGGSAAQPVSNVVDAANSPSIPKVSSMKRKTHTEDENDDEDADCVLMEAAELYTSSDVAEGTETVESMRKLNMEVVRKFKNSSRALSGKNKKLKLELAVAGEKILSLQSSSGMAQVNKTLMNNAVATAIQQERAAGLKSAAAEITKAKFAMEKIHMDELSKLRTEVQKIHKEHDKELSGLVSTMFKKDALVKVAVNELRHTELFGVSSSRGIPFCAISQTDIMPMERVYALNASCDCNNMVKVTHGERYMRDFEMHKEVTCLTCRKHVTKVVATTAKAAEMDYAWRAVEVLTGCDGEQTVVDRYIKKNEDDKEAKKTQDTKVFRDFIQDFVKAAPKT